MSRDLRDAASPGLSSDRRFAIAYNAVLQLLKMVIACRGYRVAGTEQEQTSIECLPLAMGRAMKPLADYLDICRRKRYTIDYDHANEATESEAKDLRKRAEELRIRVEAWIREKYPELTEGES